MAACSLALEQFTCPICLDLFSVPVTIPCGHNFCQGCIKTFWSKGNQNCPFCLKAFPQIPDVCVNHTLVGIMHSLKLDEPNVKAAKTLGNFDFQGSSVSQDDNPQQPQLDDNLVCVKHDEVLSLICQRDKTLICPQCTSNDHKNHETVPAEEQIPQIKQMLMNEKLAAMNSAHAIMMEVLKARTSIESFKVSASLQKEQLEADFTALMSAITDVKKEAMASVEKEESTTLQETESKVEKMEAVCTCLKDDIAKMDLGLNSGDPQKLLQAYNTVQGINFAATKASECVVVDLEKRLAQSSNIRQQLINAVEKIWRDQASVKRQTFDYSTYVSLTTLRKYKRVLTLDPKTAGSYIWVSLDATKARNSYPLIQPEVRDTKDMKSHEVRAKEGFTGGQHFWEVLFEPSDNFLGVVGVKSNRDKMSWVTEMVLTSEKQPKPLVNVYHSNTLIEKIPSARYGMFGVFLDYESGILCIYGIGNGSVSLMYTFTTNFSNHCLFPVFELSPKSHMRFY